VARSGFPIDGLEPSRINVSPTQTGTYQCGAHVIEVKPSFRRIKGDAVMSGYFCQLRVAKECLTTGA
jgi:hypothetical protein